MSREKLIQFVQQKHANHKRKYTGDPYFIHVLAVANESEKYGIQYGFEIGLCHDLLEDTECTPQRLKARLISYGYTEHAACFILSRVIELTDVFTNESLPYLNRKIRKQCEALRLHTISKEAQIVKCFDLINNTSSIVQHDPGFAVKYIAEKREILKGFNKIDGKIKTDVWNCLLGAEEKLNNLKNE